MAETKAFSDFLYSLQRLEALYIEICEVKNDFKETIKSLTRELTVVHLVALAEAYRRNVMLHIFTHTDSFLRKSTSEISYSDVLNIGNWEDLKSEIVSREVEETIRVGYGNWINKLRKDGILPTLNIPALDWHQVEELIATRNILVHNRGLIDEEYIRRSKHWYGMNGISQPKVGDPRPVDTSYYMNSVQCLKRTLGAIDSQTVAQYPN